MVIDKGIEITRRTSGEIVFKRDGVTVSIDTCNANYGAWEELYRMMNSTLCADRPVRFGDIEKNEGNVYDDIVNALNAVAKPATETENEGESAPIDPMVVLKETLEKTINFFKEFEFEPNYRFMNTLSFKASINQTSALDYISNYFALVDNSYKTEINTKCKSKEFKEILKNLKAYAKPTNHINQRFAVYYGSAGTGKTTLAMQESDNRCVVCNASMLPSDLMEDFVFNGGQPTFQKSSLWNCMEQGLPIVLDEINLLPFDSLRFLQGILDGKKEFDYKGHKVTIADGFKVIGTMNLSIGGMIYGLPEPLIDRCADMKQFSLSADQLLSAVI